MKTQGQVRRHKRGLFGSIPRRGARAARLTAIAGAVPSPRERPSGCSFRTRCPDAEERCAREEQALAARGTSRFAACWKVGGG